MKKLVLTMVALAAGAILVHAQGLISLAAGTSGTVQTNNGVGGFGSASGAYGTYDLDVLDMTAAQWAGLSGAQQTAAANVYANPSALGLWVDSGVTGFTGSALAAGRITALGGAGGTTAANWAAPSGASYSASAIDYYMIVGWTTGGTLTSWGSVSNAIAGGSLPETALSFYGQSAIYNNAAGGGAALLPVVNVFATSAGSTGLAGTGTPSGDVAGLIQLNPIASVPEPTTLALAGLGGIATLFLRRRKA
jgi:hypothetical protein